MTTTIVTESGVITDNDGLTWYPSAAYRTIQVPDLPAPERSARLGDLAREVRTGFPAAGEVRILLAAYANPTWDAEERAQLWKEYLTQADLANGLAGEAGYEWVSWQQIYPEYTCREPQRVAIEEARAAADAALRVMVHGETA